jgi:hypothetical protein
MDSILFWFFLTGLTRFSGYFFQALLMKAWKPLSPAAINETIA